MSDSINSLTRNQTMCFISSCNSVLIGSSLVLSMTLISQPAFAGTDTTNLTVTANVVASCTITTNPIGFVYDNSTNSDAAADIAVSCTNGASTVITINQGDYPMGGSTDASPLRSLYSSSANHFLAYNLYQNSSRNIVWGNTPDSAKPYTGTGSSELVSVYGRINAGENPPVAGDYTDTVAVTITF